MTFIYYFQSYVVGLNAFQNYRARDKMTKCEWTFIRIRPFETSNTNSRRMTSPDTLSEIINERLFFSFPRSRENNWTWSEKKMNHSQEWIFIHSNEPSDPATAPWRGPGPQASGTRAIHLLKSIDDRTDIQLCPLSEFTKDALFDDSEFPVLICFIFT